MRRLVVVVGAASLLTTLLVVVGPADVAAANDVIAPTTTTDVSDPGDGLVSLREAVVLANETAGADTIVLAADKDYVLDTDCTDSPVFLMPALKVHDPAGLTIEGQRATITQTGESSWFHCDRRVISNDDGLLTLRDVTLRGGVAGVYCQLHPECHVPPDEGFGGAVRSDGPVVLEGAQVVDGDAAWRGGGVSSGATVTATDSTIAGNEAASGGGIHATGAVTLTRTVVTGNRAPLGSTWAGVYPGVGGGVGSQSSVVVVQSLVAGNVAEGTTIAEQCNGARGGGISAPSVVVDSSTIVENVAEPDHPEGCATGAVGQGGGVSATDLTLEHATITGNLAGAGAALRAGESVAITASVLDGPPGSSLCAKRGEVVSHGYNVMTSWCGFPARRTDRRHVPSLGLGPLADNGGPTLTRLPTTDGPLSIIPVTACSTDPDQRGQPRPQGACEAGAVEVDGASEPIAAPSVPPHPFSDVPASPAGADEAIDWAAAHALVTDRGDHLFRPDATVNRKQAILYLWRLMGTPPPPTAERLPLRDVPIDAAYRRSVRWAYQVGLLHALHLRSNRYLDPTKRVTRYQFTSMLWRVAGQPGSGLTAFPWYPFPDLPGDVSRVPMDWVAYLDLVPGLTGPFRPNEGIHRIDAIVLLHRTASNPEAWTENDPPPTSDF